MIGNEEDIYFIERVKYASSKTPIENREYSLVGRKDFPVGTLKEWEDWAVKNNKVVVIKNKKILKKGVSQ